jgi:hypothetical protein
MRDKRFIAVHRGGFLSKEDHHKLIRWARECSEHVLALIDGEIDSRLLFALHVAKEWEHSRTTTGEAMKASVSAHAAAREYSNPVSVAVARSVGQTVATAHMADHSMGGALYALKARSLAGKSIDDEFAWQKGKLEQLPAEILELVLTTMAGKAKGFSIFDKNLQKNK